MLKTISACYRATFVLLFIFLFSSGVQAQRAQWLVWGGVATAGYELGAASAPTPSGGLFMVANVPLDGFYIADAINVPIPTIGKYLFNMKDHTIEETKVTADSGAIITGYFDGGITQEDIFLMKLDANRNVDWVRVYPRPGREFGYSVIQTNDGGYAVGGEAVSNLIGSDFDITIIRTDAMGNSIYENVYDQGGNEEGARAIIQTNDGNLVVAGWRDSLKSPLAIDVMMMKVQDNNGNLIWYNWYGEGFDDFGQGLREVPNGDLAVTGWSESLTAGGRDAFLLRTNSNGVYQFMYNYGGGMDDEGKSIEVVGNNGFIIGGRSNSFNVPGFTNMNYYGLRLSGAGAVIWSRIYGSVFDEECQDVHLGPNNGFYFHGGVQVTGALEQYMYLVKTNSVGDALCLNAVVNPQRNLILPDTFSCFPIISKYSVSTKETYREAAILNRGLLCFNAMAPVSGDADPVYQEEAQDIKSLLKAQPNNRIQELHEYFISSQQKLRLDAVDMQIYPNPAQNMLSIRVKEGSLSSYEILDLQGRVLLSKRELSNGSEVSVDLSGLTEGAYFLRALDDQGHQQTHKIIKQ